MSILGVKYHTNYKVGYFPKYKSIPLIMTARIIME